jgi:hypothetical protein
MWKPPIHFITLHCEYQYQHLKDASDYSYADTYIVFLGILGLIVIYPYGNLAAVDAYFFGVSASTESGLNTFVALPYFTAPRST